MPEEFDCQACGACCATFDVWLDEADRTRFEGSPRLVRLTVLQKPSSGAAWDWRFLRRDRETGRCAALEGQLTACRCTIYEDRPRLCRVFEAGSDECRKARRAVHGYVS
jgi:Fe-S-cluster containining protein